MSKRNTSIEDYNIISPDNKIWNKATYMECINLVDDVSDNPYPVMYVEGDPVWEGDKILYTKPLTPEKEQIIRKVCWQHRSLVDEDWVKNWSFKIKKN